VKIRKILLILNLALIGLLGYVVFDLVFHQDLPDNAAALSPDPLPEPDNAQPPAHSVETSNYSDLVNRNLFHDKTASTPPPPPQTSVADQTSPLWQINLILRGTITGPPQIARAILHNPSSKTTSSYKIGDVIDRSAGDNHVVRLDEIRKKAVTLACNGQKRILRQETPSETGGAETKNSPPNRTAKPIAAFPVNGSARQLRTELIEDFLNTVRIEPYLVRGQPQGLKVSGLEKLREKNFLGLQNGDVIQVVNGQQLTNKQKAFQVLRKARTHPWLNIELIRADQPKTLSYPLR